MPQHHAMDEPSSVSARIPIDITVSIGVVTGLHSGQPLRGEQPSRQPSDEAVHDRIAKFKPRDGRSSWNGVAGDVRRVVTAAGPVTAADAARLMSVVTRLAIYCHGLGLGLGNGSWFKPAIIDRFLLERCAHLKPGTHSNYRSTLRRLR